MHIHSKLVSDAGTRQFQSLAQGKLEADADFPVAEKDSSIAAEDELHERSNL